MPKKKKKISKKIQEEPKNLLAVGEEDEQVDLSESTGVSKEPEEEDGESNEELDLSAEIDTNLKIAIRHKSKWNEIAREDIKFALGDQWDPEDVSLLESQNRPVLTFNKIKPMVQLVAGHLIQNQARIQCYPEGGEDEVFSAVMDKILDHIDKVSHLNFKLSYQFAGGERAGRTWLEFYQDYNEDPIFGQLKIPNLGPFKIYMDPTGTEYDLSDCQYGFKVVQLSKGVLKQLFPEKQEEIDALTDDSMDAVVKSVHKSPGDESDYGNDPHIPGPEENSDPDTELKGDLQMLTVIEYCKRVYEDRWFVYFVSDGAIEEYETKEEAEAAVLKRKTTEAGRMMKETAGMIAATTQLITGQTESMPMEMPPVAPVDPTTVNIEHAMRQRRVRRMKVAIKAGDLILTKGLEPSPFEPHYHEFYWFQYIAEWAPESEQEELKVQSLVRSLKDPQREVNKSRSQYLHILNSSANSGWIGDDNALSEQKKEELKQFGSTPGITIWKKPGSVLERINPVEPSMAQNVREKAATDDFKEVSGINADLLSIDSKASPSGKAIALRIRQAVTILQPSFQNFRYTKLLIGQFLFKIVPSMFDAAKIEKILGQQFMADHELDRAQLQAYLTMIEDGKYNVQISEAGSTDTLRAETFEDLMTMVEKGMQIPPDVILEFMTLPNKQEVLRKIAEYQQQQQAAMMQQAGPAAPGPAR